MMRKICSALLKARIRFGQKKYKALTYYLERGRSDVLIVSFSGFSADSRARYNYINTLKDVEAYRLFILDDFGYEKRGSYYLGENGDWFIPEMVAQLVETIRAEYGIKKLIMIGSSKGGTAALYYAVKLQADACVIGAPQYHCGEYLSTEDHLPILKGIMGDSSAASIQKLNEVMPTCLMSALPRKPQVYIHYSPLEHTYPEHIADMITALNENGYTVFEDANYEYTDHSHVAKYFPAYLKAVLQDIL